MSWIGLKWFVYMEMRDKGRLPKRIYRSEMGSSRGRDRFKRRWSEGRKELVGKNGLNFQ